jgi:hypothetical protein
MIIDMKQLLTKIERYIETHGLSETAFSMMATGTTSGTLVKRLRSGNVNMKTIRRVDEFLEHVIVTDELVEATALYLREAQTRHRRSKNGTNTEG